MTLLTGRVALVTGAGSGLGQAIAETLCQHGAVVTVADIRPHAARDVAGQITANGGCARHTTLDVSDPAQSADTIRETVDRYGRLDILVNNAGVDRTVPFEELSLDEWDRILGVNLRGPFLMAHHAYPLMCKQRDGHIVNIVSTAARRAWPNASAYHTSKWGLLGLSHALHVEGRARGVKVTAVIAGGMRTPFLLERFPDLDPNLLQEPRNVAEAVAFVLMQPAETVVPEITVLPMEERSWP